MEHREPPRTGEDEFRTRSVAPAAPDRLALPRLGPSQPVRLGIDRARAMLVGVIFLGVLAGCALVFWAARAASSWLADQPAYQIPFGAIVLDPPPPPWYRGGRDGFLEDVRRRSGMPETIPLLKLKAEELGQAFKGHCPWTEDDPLISYPPLGVTVRLKYRVPVAIVETPAHKNYLVDGTATILPQDDVDLERLEQVRVLLTIKGEGLIDPQDPRPGLPWKPRAGLVDIAPGNERIPAAARLAAFLSEKLHAIDRASNTALNYLYINPMDADSRGLFLWNHDEKTYILWGEAPGEESPGSLSAEEKWAKICDWGRAVKQRTLPDGHFWRIAGSGLIPDGAERRPPASARAIASPRDDRQAILAKDPG